MKPGSSSRPRPDQWGLIRVGVANLRCRPGHRAELGTQALLGTVIRILRPGARWSQAGISCGYRGWIEAGQFVPCSRAEIEAWENSPLLIVTALADHIRERPSDRARPVSDVVAGSLLKQVGVSGRWHHVQLPDGRSGFLPAKSAIDYAVWRRTIRPTVTGLERTARQLLGVSYLWGGTSSRALDCSGFTRTVFALNGVKLKRDARDQAMQGRAVAPGRDFARLRRGDLLFFGRRPTATSRGQIGHVAMYLGGRKYIHAASLVQVNSLDPTSPLFDARRLATFIHARRILGVR